MKNTLISTENQHFVKEYNFDTLAQELFEVTELRKKLALQEEDLKKRLESYLASIQVKAWMGHSFIFSSYDRKGGIDYSVIPELKHIDLEQYRKKPVLSWKLSKI